MIPLWLTPKVIKGSIIGLIVIAIFSFGFWTSHKLDAGKIERLKADYQTLSDNNRQCLDQNTRAAQSIDELEAAITSQNESFTKLAAESAEALAKQRLKSRLALEAYQKASSESEAKLEAEKQDLLKRMELMTACESCNEAWLEVVQ